MSDTPRLSCEELAAMHYVAQQQQLEWAPSLAQDPLLGEGMAHVPLPKLLAILAELRSLRALAREIGSNTPTLDDERLPYVKLQVDRGSWEEVKSYAK